MPELDGIELLKVLKKDFDPMPLVFLISGTSKINLKEAYDLGAQSILSKPIKNEELLQLVNLLVPSGES